MDHETSVRLPRSFYTRQTLVVARDLLGKVLVHRLSSGVVLKGRIVETEAYAGVFDPASHTYRGRRTERNAIWYGEGGFAYVYQIYGIYECLGIITEPPQIPGAVLIRAVEPTDGPESFCAHEDKKTSQRLCAGPSRLCLAMQIDQRCHGLDLCGEDLYLEDRGEQVLIEHMVFGPRINIDYAGHGAVAAWRYYLRESGAVSKKTHEPLRAWLTRYPSQRTAPPVDLFTHLVQSEEESPMREDMLHELRSRPKVELHLHLEGMMRPATLRQLCQQNRVALPAHLQEGETHTFGTFDEFVYTYYRICQSLVHAQDFALLIADVADYLRHNTILYAEIAWTPFLYLNRATQPLRFADVMEVMNEALERQGIADRVRFLIDMQRDHGTEAGAWIAQQVYAAPADWRIVGIGLVGQEEGFSPADYQTLFRQAREHGLGTTAHAGEYGTSDDIWHCLRSLGVTRIGHGIRAVHDHALVAALVDQQVHLEVCLTSNVRLARVPSYSSHPLRDLWRAGVNLGLNSDDPGLFATDLSREYGKATHHCGLSLADLRQTLVNSLNAAFLPQERKEALAEVITREWRSE